MTLVSRYSRAIEQVRLLKCISRDVNKKTGDRDPGSGKRYAVKLD